MWTFASKNLTEKKRAGGERPYSAPVRVTRAIRYLGFRAEGHSGPGRQLLPQQPPVHAGRAGTEGAAGEVDDGPHVCRTSPHPPQPPFQRALGRGSSAEVGGYSEKSAAVAWI